MNAANLIIYLPAIITFGGYAGVVAVTKSRIS
jgi:hypothetical protein